MTDMLFINDYKIKVNENHTTVRREEYVRI